MAEEQHCSLIVLGTHGRTGLSRVLLGSVAEDVIRHSRVPVLTLKTPFLLDSEIVRIGGGEPALSEPAGGEVVEERARDLKRQARRSRYRVKASSRRRLDAAPERRAVRVSASRPEVVRGPPARSG